LATEEARVVRLIGEYRPPREVVAMGIARMNGRGTLTASTAGLRVEGRVTRAPLVSYALLWAAGFALLVVGAVLPGAEPIVVPLLVAGTLAGVWMAWRSEYGAAGHHDIALYGQLVFHLHHYCCTISVSTSGVQWCNSPAVPCVNTPS
jgi:hypothetical protein